MADKKSKKIIIIAMAVCLLAAAIAAISISSLNRKTYTVTFYSDNEKVLSINTVKRNDCASPPNEPQISYGNVFIKWDKDFSKVKKDLDIHPVCESFDGKKNVFSTSGAYAVSNQSANVHLALSGDVCTAGFEISIEYDSKSLALESVYNEDGDLIYNTDNAGKIILNLASAQNITGDVDICDLKFGVLCESGEYPLKINVEKVFTVNEDNSITATDFNVIDSSVFVISQVGNNEK